MSTDQPPAFRLQNVGLRRGDTWILRHINWSVPQGACAAILGPNGSGKSTLTRILACHYWPTEGESSVLGSTFGDANLLELRKSIRLVQPAGPYDIDSELTARQVILTGFFGTLGLYDPTTPAMEAEADRLLNQVGLLHVADHVYATLSSGEKVRNLIARALVREPRLLLLDEPTAGLDLLAREQVLATIQALFETQSAPPTVARPPPPEPPHRCYRTTSYRASTAVQSRCNRYPDGITSRSTPKLGATSFPVYNPFRHNGFPSPHLPPQSNIS